MSGSDPVTEVYDQRAAEYDNWFADNPVFAAELACLRAIRTPLPQPRLEIGVGPGRFAERLGTAFGMDGAFAPLRFAVGRGIVCFQADAAELPLADRCAGTVFLLFTFCFLLRPEKVLREIHRVLVPKGRLVVAIIVADSPWGEAVNVRKAAGHPFYRHARLYTAAEARRALQTAGLAVFEERSALLSPADGGTDYREMDRIVSGAGCGVFVAGKGA